MANRGRKPFHPIDMHVGRRVRIRRVLNGLSQTALAEKLDITFQQEQKYETGANRISASRLWMIAQALDVPVEWFFAGMDGADDAPVAAGPQRDRLELMKNYDCCDKDEQRVLRQTALLFAQRRRDPVPMAAE